MANISSQLSQLSDFSTNGKKARTLIVEACELIDKNGNNASTLQGYTSEYFVSKEKFQLRTNPYLKKIGLVHNLDEVVDEKGNHTILTQTYKDNIVMTPFDTKPGVVTVKVTDPNAKYTVTLPTSNAIWRKLGYSDLNDLESYIRS